MYIHHKISIATLDLGIYDIWMETKNKDKEAYTLYAEFLRLASEYIFDGGPMPPENDLRQALQDYLSRTGFP
jgi:hypothetical protein